MFAIASCTPVDLSTSDAALKPTAVLVRVTGAGNLVLRYPSDSADVTIAVKDGEYVPVAPSTTLPPTGTIIRKTGTTVTSMVAFSG